ncbi:hypothetical protein E4T56_gene3103, partial [Termitomyces sp. T112]
ALMAIVARTDAAGNADPRHGLLAAQIERVGIDELAGQRDFTPQHHRIAARRAEIGIRGFDQPLGKENKAPPLGHLGHLQMDAVGDRHRLMRDPQRTGAAETRELQTIGRVALGDIARHVDPAKSDGYAALVGPLQVGQAVAGLFKTGAEDLAQAVNIMAQPPRRVAKRAIGHQQSPRRIIGQPHGEQIARGLGAHPALLHRLGNLLRQRDGAKLIGQLKAQTLMGLARVQRQFATGLVIMADRRAWQMAQGDALAFEPRGQLRGVGRGQMARQGPGHGLGAGIDEMDVIVGQMEPVAYLLPRQASARNAAVEMGELLGKLGALVGHTLDLIGGQVAQQRVGGGLQQFGDDGFDRSFGHIGPVHREDLAHPFGQRQSHGPRVIFQLREIGRADPQPLRQRALFQAMILAQGLEESPRIEPPFHAVPLLSGSLIFANPSFANLQHYCGRVKLNGASRP